MNESPSQSKGYFPDDIIPVSEKDYKWCLQWMRAAYNEYTSLQQGSMYLARDRYSFIQSVLQGRQSIAKYMDQMGIDDEGSDPWVALDWTPIKWLAALRDMVIAKVSKRDYSITCKPIDVLAQEEMEDVLRKMQARLEIRKALKTQGIDPSQTQYAREEGEPEDDLEMELLRKYTFKHHFAMQAEQMIDVIFNANHFNEMRKQLKKDLFEFGVCGVKDWIDSSGSVRLRRLNPARCIASPCERNDYKDIRYAGEVRRMLVADLIQEAGDQFTQEQYVEIARAFVNRFGNPVPLSEEDIYTNYRDYKIEVLDLEWFSVNNYTWEKRVNRFGNTVVGMINPDKMREGQEYIRKNFKVVYKGSWIIGSEYLYNWGLATNMKRKRRTLHETTLSYHFRALDFFENIVVSPAERMIPYADQLQLLWMKFQFLTTQLRGNGIAIEIGALEDIAMGEGGENFEPLDVLDLYHQRGSLFYRRLNASGQEASYEPIRELRHDNSVQLQNVWNQIINVISLMKQQVGFNDMTDGSSYDPRALKTAVAAAEESTNNALWGIVSAERHLFEDIADSTLMRGQTVLRVGGNIRGYTTALGTDTTTFFAASPDLSLYDFGIVVNDIPTDDERSRLIEEARSFVAADLLEIEDLTLIKYSRNLKQAEAILAVKVERRRKKKQEESNNQIQMNGQVQQQSAMVAAQQERETEMLKHQLELERINATKQWEYRIKELEISARLGSDEIQAQASLIRTGVTTESKEQIERERNTIPKKAGMEAGENTES